jgi:hypothetical protein
LIAAAIEHELEMRAAPADIFRALTEEAGPAAWWSRDRVRMSVVTLSPARVAWRCVDGPPDWLGTEISFDLCAAGDETRVRLSHTNWSVPSVFLGRCATRWACFLLALKRHVETAEPQDLLC